MLSLYQIIKNDYDNHLNDLIQNYSPDLDNQDLNKGHRYFPLEGCVAYDSKKCFDILIDHGCNINQFGTVRLSTKRAVQGDPYYFDIIYQSPDIDISSGLLACSNKKFNDIELFKKLLNHPNSKNCNKFDSYLLTDIILFNGVDYLKLLIEHDLVESLINTLSEAIEKKKYDIIQCLIDNGADVNLCPSSYPKIYPICRASKDGNGKMIKFLLDKGADPNKISPIRRDGNSKEKMTPLMILAWKRNDQYKYNVNTSCKCAEILLKAGADPNYESDYGITVLQYAISSLLPKFVEILLKHGATLNNNDILSITERPNYFSVPSEDFIAMFNLFEKHNLNILHIGSRRQIVIENGNFKEVERYENLLIKFMLQNRKIYDFGISQIINKLKVVDNETREKYLNISFREGESLNEPSTTFDGEEYPSSNIFKNGGGRFFSGHGGWIWKKSFRELLEHYQDLKNNQTIPPDWLKNEIDEYITKTEKDFNSENSIKTYHYIQKNGPFYKVHFFKYDSGTYYSNILEYCNRNRNLEKYVHLLESIST